MSFVLKIATLVEKYRGTAAEILPQILADTLGGCPVLTKEVKA